jgi:hypothetical protein
LGDILSIITRYMIWSKVLGDILSIITRYMIWSKVSGDFYLLLHDINLVEMEIHENGTWSASP